MRAEKELQEWLNRNPINYEESEGVMRWLYSCWAYSESINFGILKEGGATLIDVIDFINSPSPSKEKDLSPIVAQFAKVKKEVDKLQKLISKL